MNLKSSIFLFKILYGIYNQLIVKKEIIVPINFTLDKIC